MQNLSDFEEMLLAFNAEKVKYLVVGAFALATYARPRATGDSSLPTSANSAAPPTNKTIASEPDASERRPRKRDGRRSWSVTAASARPKRCRLLSGTK